MQEVINLVCSVLWLSCGSTLSLSCTPSLRIQCKLFSPGSFYVQNNVFPCRLDNEISVVHGNVIKLRLQYVALHHYELDVFYSQMHYCHLVCITSLSISYYKNVGRLDQPFLHYLHNNIFLSDCWSMYCYFFNNNVLFYVSISYYKNIGRPNQPFLHFWHNTIIPCRWLVNALSNCWYE